MLQINLFDASSTEKLTRISTRLKVKR